MIWQSHGQSANLASRTSLSLNYSRGSDHARHPSTDDRHIHATDLIHRIFDAADQLELSRSFFDATSLSPIELRR